FIVNNMPGEKAVVYLLDAPFSKNPLNFVSNLFLAAAVYHRLLKPQIYALSKIDMVNQSEVEKMISWTLDFEELSCDLESEAPTQSLVMRDLAEALERTGLITEPIPTSSRTMEGFTELSAAITRTLARGEEASD
ncbi:MAG: ATP/GTP-binding protein, partial [Candidatus Bathyarchaeia archaeon]